MLAKFFQSHQMNKTLLLFLFLLPFSSLAAEPDPQTCNEVEQLLDFVKTSSCQFNRNGSWYASSDAAGHIDKKYHAALDKDLVHSTEDFIKYAASGSSLTGTPYKVRCAGGAIINSDDWLIAQLRRMREQK